MGYRVYKNPNLRHWVEKSSEKFYTFSQYVKHNLASIHQEITS